MSGGSFNYAYRKRFGDWGGQDLSLSDLERMVQFLSKRGQLMAAERLQTAIDYVKCANLVVDEMEDVMHGIEWIESSDYVESDLKEIVDKWKAKRRDGGRS